MKRLILCLVLMVPLLLSAVVEAALCSHTIATSKPSPIGLQNSPMVVPINLSGTITVPRDTPVGTVIYHGQLGLVGTGGDYPYGSCKGPSTIYYGNYSNPPAATDVSTGIAKTNVPGVGIKVLVEKLNYGATAPYIVGGSDANVVLRDSSILTYDLIKTSADSIASDLKGADLPGGTYGIVLPETYTILTYSFTGTLKIQNATCSTETNIPVDMGAHKINEFKGIGSKTVPAEFKITLSNCPSGLKKVFYQINAVTPVITQGVGVASLDGGAGSAEGIGVQISDNTGQPISFGQPYAFSGYTGAAGTYSIPLKAAYYQFGEGISAGRANTSMTFTMSYQ